MGAALVVDKLNREHMLSVAKEAKLAVSENMSAKAVAAALSLHYKKLPPSDKAGCDICHGESPASLPACAFCGTADDEEPEEKPKKGATVVKRTMAPEKGGDKPALALVKPARESTPALQGTVLPAEDAKKMVPGAGGLALDAAVKEIARIKGEHAAACWDLGKFIQEKIYDTKLWMQRVVDGKPAYKSFAAWVRAEAGVSESYAFTAMEVARSFSRDEATLLGSKHLTTLVGAPREDRKELLQKAKAEGLTVRETKQLVDDTRKAKGTKNKSASGRAMPTSPGRPVERIALTLGTGRIKIPLLKKGTDKPARRLGDNPVLTIVGQNGVELTLSIHEDASGDLVAVGTPKKRERE